EPRRSPFTARLQILLPKAPAGESTGAWVRALIRGGADSIQLRQKEATDREFTEIAREVRGACDAGGAIFIVNDRVDAALASEADGVHLGQDDMDPREARHILGDTPLIGVSCHSVDEAIQAEAAGADYIAVGCIFASPTKPDLRPVGPELIAEIARRVRRPLVAIGGIRPENVALVIRAGAQAAAVSSAILSSPDLEGATRRLREAIPDR
ncbi:MAG: thiamine phosphate synthase, partial [Planctomycetota bacterium]|nr:thiamine phosphate synthase [Planctomycetota bacterium]